MSMSGSGRKVNYADFIHGATNPALGPLLEHVSCKISSQLHTIDVLCTVSGPSKLEAAALTFKREYCEVGRL